MNSKKKFNEINNINDQAFKLIQNDPGKGIELSKEAFKASKTLKYMKGIAESKFTEGWCLIVQNKYNKSLKALEYSLINFELTKNSIGQMKTFNALGVLYSNISNYETAMKYYSKSLELSKKLKIMNAWELHI